MPEVVMPEVVRSSAVIASVISKRDPKQLFRSTGAPMPEEMAGATVGDFWAWNYSNLLADVTRGAVAEFIVARLIGCQPNVLGDPDREYDCKTAAGHTVEVKSSAYLESFALRRPRGRSDIRFSGLKCKLFSTDPEKPAFGEEAYQSQLFVFCLLEERDPVLVDPLHLDQWNFYVATRQDLEAIGGATGAPRSVGLYALEKRMGKHAVSAFQLGAAVLEAERQLVANAVHSTT